MKHRSTALLTAGMTLTLTSAVFADANHGFNCDNVRFGQPNWTGASIKTETAVWMLEEMGYETEVTQGSLPIVYNAMEGGDIDVLLAQWMPSQRELFMEFATEGSLDVVSPNLVGGRYTLAVPDYVYAAGVTSVDDLAEHKERFGGEIYGIEPGSGGNDTITEIIDHDYAGLGDWELVASSEPGMLAEVSKRERNEEWIVFLGWAPHPMNINHDFEYLAGAEDYWGPNKGEVIVNTVTPTGYAWACANVGQFLDNYNWTVKEQSLAMEYVNNEDMDPLAAGKRVIEQNPEMLERWFDQSGIYQTGGIKTADGESPARSVVTDALGL